MFIEVGTLLEPTVKSPAVKFSSLHIPQSTCTQERNTRFGFRLFNALILLFNSDLSSSLEAIAKIFPRTFECVPKLHFVLYRE